MSTPRIVVLDGEKFSDLSWEPLRALGNVVVHERSKAPEIPDRAAGADIVLTNKAPLSAETLAKLPALRYIGVLATGHNVVDSAAARARHIPVTNVPEYGTLAVAQHVFALLLELTQQTGAYAAGTRSGRWVQGKADWCYWDKPLVELAGLQLGLVGSGRIGQAVAKIATAFGMKVVFAQRAGAGASRDKLPLEQVMRTSDVVSLHCPLTPDTKEMIRVDETDRFPHQHQPRPADPRPGFGRCAQSGPAGRRGAGRPFGGASAGGQSPALRPKLPDHPAPGLGRHHRSRPPARSGRRQREELLRRLDA